MPRLRVHNIHPSLLSHPLDCILLLLLRMDSLAYHFHEQYYRQADLIVTISETDKREVILLDSSGDLNKRDKVNTHIHMHVHTHVHTHVTSSPTGGDAGSMPS